MEEILLNLARVAIVAAAAFVIYLAKDSLSESQRKKLKIIIEEGILYAQEAYEELDGKERYEKALEYISKELKDQGIKVDPDRLDALVHAVLKDLKKEFGYPWSEKEDS